ncbi:hypothetical protein [Streptomyces sp. NPDC127038]|uniref:hypothetical protein n=1 Tax=Streptomyces sp. NPDC127038 TaxID=3347114 RepID=UPI0036614E60
MALSSGDGRDASYDPRAVRQRYDLEGDSRIHVPLLVDLERRTFLWTDLHLAASEGFHSVYRHSAELGRVGRDLFQYFTTGRTTLWDLSVWHAAARSDEVVVVRRLPSTGELWHYRRAEAEPDAAFAAGSGPWSLRSGGARPRTRTRSPRRRPRRSTSCSRWCTAASPRRARAGPCTGCCPARSTAAV